MPNYSKMFDLARNLYALPSYNSRYGRALMPLRYFFELTYRCNLQCPYCYVGEDRNKQELSTEEWFKIIDQVPFYSFITLVGGEPLIRKDFIKILEKACKKTLSKVNVVSNGILINDEIIEAFIRTKMLLLSVSLDGYGKNHDLNRNKDGIFDKIMTNLDNLNSRKKRPMVDIKTIVLENNLDDLPKLFKLCDDKGFEFLSISFLRNNNLKQNSSLHDSFIEEFNGNYPIKKYFDMEHFKEVGMSRSKDNGTPQRRIYNGTFWEFANHTGGILVVDKDVCVECPSRFPWVGKLYKRVTVLLLYGNMLGVMENRVIIGCTPGSCRRLAANEY